MEKTITYVGLDVHKNTIAVALLSSLTSDGCGLQHEAGHIRLD